MAETSGFFDAEQLTDDTYDREYVAEQFANYFKLFIGNGVFASPTNQLQVVAGDTLHVVVKAGWAFINGYWYHNSEDKIISIVPNASANDRTDSIMARLDKTSRTISVVALMSTTDPTRTDPYYDLQLAKVFVPAAAQSISPSYITDMRTNESVCGFVKGLMEVVSSADLFAQFSSQFSTWFDLMKGQLTTDAAGNLQTEIDTINAQTIGGSNLLTGSKDFSGTWVNSDKWTTKADKYKGFVVKKSAIAYGGLSQAFSVPNNTKLVYSFYAKTDNPSATHAVYAADDAYANEFDKTYEIVKLTTEWARYEVTFTSKVDNAHANIRLHLATGTAITYICAPCLQYGDKATEWVPNELDAVNQINTVLGDLFTGGVAHNTIYRGKNLGSAVTAKQYAAISAGTFEDLYIGDYWTIGGVNYRIAAFDYYWNCGDNAVPPHHAVIVPDKILCYAIMNPTDTTAGGYVGSQMHTTNLARAKETIKAAFSGHVVKHRIYLVNAVINGRSSGGAWFDSEVDLMNEQMVYGCGIFSPVSAGGATPANYRVEKNQLPLFTMNPAMLNIRVDYWLRDVITSSGFALVASGGGAACNSAASLSVGVRPAFCIS